MSGELTPEERAELQRLRQKFGAAPGVTNSVVTGMGESIYGGIAQTLNLPGRAMNAAADFLARPLSIGGLNLGGAAPEGPGADFRFGGLPLPSGRDITAAIESPAQAVMAGQSLAEAFGSRRDYRAQAEATNPTAHMIGQGLGDAALLSAGRARFVPSQGSTGLFDALARNGVDSLGRLANPQGLSRGARHLLQRGITSDAVQSVFRGVGRTAEAGLEGYALGVLQGGDPQDLAAVGAVNQAVASTGNVLADATFGAAGNRTLRNTATGVLGTFFAIQLLRSGVGDDDVIDTLGDSFTKAALLGAGGYAAGLMGRRGSGNSGTLGYDLPGLADSLATIPRAQVLRLAKSIMDDADMQRAMLNATQLGTSDAKRFNEALASDDPAQGVRDLMESNARIRRALTAPDPRLANVPEMK